MKQFSIKDLKRIFVVYILISLSALSYYTFKLISGEVPDVTWIVLFGIISGLASILSLFAVFTSSVGPEDVQRILDAINRLKTEDGVSMSDNKGTDAEIDRGMGVYIAQVLKKNNSRNRW